MAIKMQRDFKKIKSTKKGQENLFNKITDALTN